MTDNATNVPANVEDLPVLVVRRDLAQDEDGRMYADGKPIAPGRYRVVLPDAEGGPAQDAVLVVGDPADLDSEDQAAVLALAVARHELERARDDQPWIPPWEQCAAEVQDGTLREAAAWLRAARAAGLLD